MLLGTFSSYFLARNFDRLAFLHSVDHGETPSLGGEVPQAIGKNVPPLIERPHAGSGKVNLNVSRPGTGKPIENPSLVISDGGTRIRRSWQYPPAILLQAPFLVFSPTTICGMGQGSSPDSG